MKGAAARLLAAALCAALLKAPNESVARDTPADNVELRAYVNDSCIIADEPFFLPVPERNDAAHETARFLPLLDIVIGKAAELFVKHEIRLGTAQLRAGGARKDTRYAMTHQMNLYRVDFQPAPAVAINARLGCMTIVAGHLEPEATDCTAAYVPKTLTPQSAHLEQSKWQTSRTDDSIENRLRRANICLVGNARAVYESRFEFSSDGMAYRLRDAGYRIDSLLTTEDAHASRNALYTLKISQPGATDTAELLTSAWVNLGVVRAGSRGAGTGEAASSWVRVPPLSAEARRLYEEKTKVHQEVMGEIGALQRAVTRDQRMLEGLDARIAGASGDVLEGLKQERTRIAVQIQTRDVELDARRAEFQDLPREPLEFMRVTVEVAVTETESEKKARLALAEILGTSSDAVAAAVGDAASTFVSKSVNAADIDTAAAGPPAAPALDRARARYFDALIEARGTQSPGKAEESRRDLAIAKDQYNEARRSLGLEPIT